MKLNIALIYGSVRTERQGIKAARFLYNMLQERGHGVTLLDPAELNLPMLDYMYKEYAPGKAPENIQQAGNTLQDADAFVVLTGEYNHSLPPALKNLLDHYQTEYFFKPSGIASYSAGGFGGVRAAIQLRIILGELGTPAVSSMLTFPVVQELFDEHGGVQDEKFIPRTERFIDELEFYAIALKEQRSKGTPF